MKRNSNQLFFNRIKILTPNPCSNAAILSPSLSQQASRSKEEKTLTWCPAPPLQGSTGSDKGEGAGGGRVCEGGVGVTSHGELRVLRGQKMDCQMQPRLRNTSSYLCNLFLDSQQWICNTSEVPICFSKRTFGQAKIITESWGRRHNA